MYFKKYGILEVHSVWYEERENKDLKKELVKLAV